VVVVGLVVVALPLAAADHEEDQASDDSKSKDDTDGDASFGTRGCTFVGVGDGGGSG